MEKIAVCQVSWRKYCLIFILSFVFSLALIQSTAAFSDYEQKTAANVYQQLQKEYQIRDFQDSSAAEQILTKLTKNITNSEFKDAEFKLHYVDDKIINAYYIGDGNIMIFAGLLKELNNNNQLAGIIAHEMGHAVNKHLSEDMKHNLGLSLLNILFNHFTENQYQQMTNITQNLIENGFSRDQEKEADLYAVDLMMRSGYNPDGLIELMQIFKRNSNNSKLLEFTQTHPIPESRIEYLEDYIKDKQSKQE